MNIINKSLCSRFLLIGTICTFSVSSVHAHDYGIGNAKSYHGGGASSHAPIGVMGDHMHKKGEYMLSYRFSHGQMNGSRIGNNQIGTNAIGAGNYGMPGLMGGKSRVVPTKMSMQMHMFGAMYAPTDWLTLMVMGSYVEKSMDHTTFNMMGGGKSRFNTKSEGIGDTKVGGMFKLFETNLLNINHHAHINFNINIPTGSLSERSDVNAPMGTGSQKNIRMPYPMQIGTGTFDALPGITYTGNYKKLAWGGQYMAEIRMERNQAGYSHGDKHQLTAWSSYEWARYFSTSARVIYKTQERIKGQDPAISAMIQTANPRNHGGRQLAVAFGVNLAGQKGILKGHRLSTEIIIPMYRDLHGPQLETDWRIVAGWQYASSFLQ